MTLSRHDARQVVLQLLYQFDLNPEVGETAVSQFLRKRLRGHPGLSLFALGLLDGVRAHRQELDAVLDSKAQNWSVQRMAIVDRNILRLGAYELLHEGTPGQVAINEAVELAKQFGDQQSPAFVNGVLDRVLRERTPCVPPAVEQGSAGPAEDG